VDGFGAAAAEHLALRLGIRDAFPAADQSLRDAVHGLAPGVVVERWRPWRALAAMYLLADRL
jgi:AraC family transcriptional regulator, regulatory protein of adaptative response / DNA-3-methyladenine glycosylase II